MRRDSRDAGSFAGGLVSKLAPSAVQLVLLLVVAREGSLEDVGKLALASAAAFLCGSLAEIGAMTSLSLPREYFGVDAPPLRATRAVRVGAAAAGSALYALLWAAGLGGHDAALLLAAPLPLVLALAFGYAGALNAGGALAREGAVSAIETAVIVGATFVLFGVTSPLAAALIALTGARALGALARLELARRAPQSDVAHIPGAMRRQLGFLASSSVLVVQGQLDIVLLGFLGDFELVAIYAPLLRTAFATFLVAEGLTLALYSAREDRPDAAAALRRWRSVGVGLGVVAALAFAALAHPFLELVLDRELQDLWVPIALFAVLIPVRFAGYVVSVDIVRAGRQAARIPALVVATALVGAGGIIGGLLDSLTWLAALRLASEVVATIGFLALWQRLPVRAGEP